MQLKLIIFFDDDAFDENSSENSAGIDLVPIILIMPFEYSNLTTTGNPSSFDKSS